MSIYEGDASMDVFKAENSPLMMTNSPVNAKSDDVHMVDAEAGQAKSGGVQVEGSERGEQQRYEQHDDPDVIIPDQIAKALVLSAQLLLINGIVAMVYSLYVLGALLLLVWLTSILHWRAPRFSSMWRILDYVAVMATIAYGTWLSTTLTLAYMLVWLVGLGVVGLIFIANETAYYVQIGKTPLGDEGSERGVILPYASPNTPERDWVYKRTTFVHLLCVHVLANALTLTIIIGSQA